MNKEIVLPSGTFASFRPLTGLDFLIAMATANEAGPAIRSAVLLLSLLSSAVKLDGREVNMDELREMPLGEFYPLYIEMSERLMKASKFSKGIA